MPKACVQYVQNLFTAGLVVGAQVYTYGVRRSRLMSSQLGQVVVIPPPAQISSTGLYTAKNTLSHLLQFCFAHIPQPLLLPRQKI